MDLMTAIWHTAAESQEYPGGSGRGVVNVGGGGYLPSTYISMRHLRAHRCTLPIQLRHLGPAEITESCLRLADTLGVQVVDAQNVPGATEFRRLAGRECKIHAIIACPFEQVLLIDAMELGFAKHRAAEL